MTLLTLLLSVGIWHFVTERGTEGGRRMICNEGLQEDLLRLRGKHLRAPGHRDTRPGCCFQIKCVCLSLIGSLSKSLKRSCFLWFGCVDRRWCHDIVFWELKETTCPIMQQFLNKLLYKVEYNHFDFSSDFLKIYCNHLIPSTTSWYSLHTSFKNTCKVYTVLSGRM